MGVEIREVSSRAELKLFIHLPSVIHSQEPNFLPPIYLDEWNFFNPKKNHSFAVSSTLLVLAWRDGKVVGRIMGIISLPYNKIHNEKNARFGFFDCYNDPEASHALLGFIERWAKEKGMEKIIGPYGFSDKDPQGFLVEGFEHLPLIASACNPPYIIQLVEGEGYVKEVDCLMFRFPISSILPPLYSRIQQRFNDRKEYNILEFSTKKQLKPYIIPVLRLMNETYDELFGFIPLTDDEIMELAERYLPIIDAHFVKIAEKDGKIVAFLVAVPNFSIGIQKSKGRLFPFGIFHLIRSAKKSKQLDMMLGAVKREFQGLGLEIVLGLRVVESARKTDKEFIEFHSILETNRLMLAEMERVKLTAHKRFRVFQKVL
jgi:GNAT superfamily N-acetyltransferase